MDTQKTLPFGTPEDVRREVAERIAIMPIEGLALPPAREEAVETEVATP